MGKLANLITGPKVSPLESLTRQAADAELDLKNLEGQDGQLTGKAYIAACAAVAGANAQEAKMILDVLGNAENAPLASSFRRMCAAIKEWPRSRPLTRLGIYIDAEGDGALGRLRVTHQSLFLAAAMQFCKLHPELFGTQTATVEERQAAMGKAVARRDELFKQLADSWERDDVELLYVNDNDRKAGLCKLGVRFTGNAVLVGPDLPRHLVDWELSRRNRKEAA